MVQITSSTLQDRSRLVGLLTQLSANKSSSSEYNLAERLAHLVGVSGSMVLSRGLRQLPSTAASLTVDNASSIQRDVLSTRERMMRVIIDSFLAEADDVQTKVPSAATGVRAEALKTFEPYKRFYVTHQVEMAVGIKDLRTRVRNAMSGFSVELHQLAELDKTLDESLETHTRKLYNVILKLLEWRFKELLQQADQEGDAAADLDQAWLEPFYQDMRELLLAEFDARLQPVVGLLEALNEQVDIIS